MATGAIVTEIGASTVIGIDVTPIGMTVGAIVTPVASPLAIFRLQARAGCGFPIVLQASNRRRLVAERLGIWLTGTEGA